MAILFAANTLVDYFDTSLSLESSTALVLALLVHALLLGLFFGIPAGIFIWAERKVSGRIQDRLGPTRTGGKFGWLQSAADGLKLIQKEDLAPEQADKTLFRFAPYVVCASMFTALLFLPFADGWVAVTLDVGLFLMLAVMSIEVVGIILAGYTSGSKWSLFGGMREAAQMVSYEIPLSISALIPVVAAGSLNLNEIAFMQRGWATNWLIFHDPFTFVAFFVYFVIATASCKRAPFDLAEAESELVGGFHTEYSGMRWSMFFLAEYAGMFIVSAIAAILFLGGWHLGIDVTSLGIDQGATSGIAGYLINIIGAAILFLKAGVLVCVQIWVRWTLPRLRIDQVMTTCLKYLIPITCFLFVGAVIWPLMLAFTINRTTLWPTPLGDRVVREVTVSETVDESETNNEDTASTEPSDDSSLAAHKQGDPQ